MNILSELTDLFELLKIPSMTAEFSEAPQPDTFALFTSISDDLDLFSDNMPEVEVCSVRITIYTKDNYIRIVRKITNALLNKDFTVSNRRYVNRETDTGYHHYAIDCEKFYAFDSKGEKKQWQK
jgi:hypothetical protein